MFSTTLALTALWNPYVLLENSLLPALLLLVVL